MKVVIDTKMERHMLETTSDDALAVTQSIMEKYEEETPFLTLWEESKNKTTTLRKSEIMEIFVYPDELHDYDKTTVEKETDFDQENGEAQRLRRMASDIDAGIACLEGQGDYELARRATVWKRTVEKRIRDLTERQP